MSGIPAGMKITLKDLEAVIDECTGISKQAAARTELQKQNLANILGVMRFPENFLVRHMQAATLLLREIGERTTNETECVFQCRRALQRLEQRRRIEPGRRALRCRSGGARRTEG